MKVSSWRATDRVSNHLFKQQDLKPKNGQGEYGLGPGDETGSAKAGDRREEFFSTPGQAFLGDFPKAVDDAVMGKLGSTPESDDTDSKQPASGSRIFTGGG
ncbi:hypothetical protein GCM10011352_18070 [Marinobacterium zhoushanense]|uniref:Uncharacterized protein n=1 Tax=Marinobacterium zhoushanense TaxID=1679163 RepID=A0ABQ1KA19_9GAMM|nr:hypothetical protein GCM10011352_18070 [Marinobacterium zhoushanense]